MIQTARPRILVAYATRAGSTAEVARFVGKTLDEHGMQADVRLAKQVTDVSSYAAVVIGSGIRMGKVLPEAVTLLRRHARALADKPLATFAVCMTLKRDTPESRATVGGYMAPLHDLKAPVSVGMFAGVVDYAKLGLITGFVIKRAAQDPNTKDGDLLEEGDYRDWDAIRAWTIELVPALLPEWALG